MKRSVGEGKKARVIKAHVRSGSKRQSGITKSRTIIYCEVYTERHTLMHSKIWKNDPFSWFCSTLDTMLTFKATTIA